MTVQAIDPAGLAHPYRTGRTAPVRPRLRVVTPEDAPVRVRSATHAPVRLTARGRLVRTLLVFGALSLLALLLTARLTAQQLPATHSVTVGAGQTLSQIAAEELPMVPLEAAVVRIQLANGLNGTQVVAGQDLVIPGE